MPTPIFLNVPSATGSFLQNCKDGMDIAKARSYAGVRFSAGLSGYVRLTQLRLQGCAGAPGLLDVLHQDALLKGLLTILSLQTFELVGKLRNGHVERAARVVDVV